MPNPVRMRAEITSVGMHGAGVYSVTLRPERRVPGFKPGQFLHLALDEFDPSIGYWPESRVFSIASGTGDPELAIAYSVKGAFTRRMADTLVVGRRVWIKLPYGHFIVDSLVTQGHDAVLVAGGTGISPFVPYLTALCRGSVAQRAVALWYGVRTPELVLFAPAIASFLRSSPFCSATIFIERATRSLEIPRALFRPGRLSSLFPFRTPGDDQCVSQRASRSRGSRRAHSVG
jgi:ferredoxin-NADP reductase